VGFCKYHVTPPMDPQELVIHNQKDVKARRIILDAVKDHLIPHLSEKKSAREMFEALTNLFQSSNTNRKMVLREKFRNTKMTRSDTVTNYLTKITQVRDQLAAVGEVVTDEEMVRTALNGFTKPWAPFIKGIVARETLPKFDRLWDDFIQEEIREESLAGQQKGDDENLALASQARKSKGKGSVKRNTGGESTSQAGKKRDLSKVKCFVCHKSGHYASQCPERKKGKGKSQQVATSADTQVKEFVERFEKDFLLVSCLSGTVSNGAWFVDSGASRHMTGTHELFTSLSEKDLDLHVELGTNAKCGVEGVGTVRFQLESGGSLEVADVLYVQSSRRVCSQFSTMEDRGYTITFEDGQVLIRRKDLALTQHEFLVTEREIYTG
jgi:hypothetical protein